MRGTNQPTNKINHNEIIPPTALSASSPAVHKLPDNLEVYRSGLMIGCGKNKIKMRHKRAGLLCISSGSRGVDRAHVKVDCLSCGKLCIFFLS